MQISHSETEKFREDTLKDLETQPMGMGGVVIKHAANEKYLGDWVNELGCKESINDIIKERMRKLTSKVNDIILLAILHWDSGMEMMKWRIAKRKLQFLKKIMAKEDSNLCKRSLLNEYYSRYFIVN